MKRRISVPLKTDHNPVAHLKRLNNYVPSMKEREQKGHTFKLSNPLDCIEEEDSKKSKQRAEMLASKSLGRGKA